MKRFFCASLMLASCGLSSVAAAHDADAPHQHTDREVDRRVDPEAYRSPRYGAFEFRVAPYWPGVDKEFDGSATPYEDSFGSKPAWAIGLEADLQLFRIPHFGSIGPGIAWHWVKRGGIAEFTNGDEGSAHPNSLWIMPMYAVAVLRVDVFKREFNIPLVPYGKFGLGVNMWESRDARSVSEVNGEKARGIETGWTLQLGGMLHLNPIAPQMAVDMDNTTGVNDAYLFMEWWLSDVDSFNKGMQVGSNTFSFGVAVEY